MPAQVDRTRIWLRAALIAGIVGATGLAGCDKAHTGLIITVNPPSPTSKVPGVAYNSLYVDVVADSDEESTSIPITAAMGKTPSSPEPPYVVIILFDEQYHSQAQKITVALKQDSTTIVSYILPPQPITQYQLTAVDANLSGD